MDLANTIINAKSVLRILLTLFPIAIGTLYLAGVVYGWGYYEFWGLNRNLFPISFQETLVYGSIAIALAAVDPIAKIVDILVHMLPVLGLIALIALVVCFVNWKKIFYTRIENINVEKNIRELDKRYKERVERITVERRFPSEEIIRRYFTYLLFPLIALMVILVVMLLFLMAFIGFHRIGISSARTEYESFLTPNSESIFTGNVRIKFRMAKDNETDVRRKLILCSENSCAFLIQDGIEVIDRNLIKTMTVLRRNSIKAAQ